MDIDLNLLPEIQWILAITLLAWLLISAIALPFRIKAKKLEIEVLKAQLERERRKL